MKDVDGCVQLFSAERVKGEVERRQCLSAKVGHNTITGDVFICYWSRKDGSVDFARNINKDVQLFSRPEAVSGIANSQCLVVQVGFIGIDKNGMPLQK